MLKGILGILLFIFFLIVLILMLTGGAIIRAIKNFRKAAQHAADQQAQRSRDEVGRQRQQYSQRRQASQQTASQQKAANQQQTAQQKNARQASEAQQAQQSEARRTQTSTGETIIDHHHQERGNRKIFDDSDGEYVDFVEEQ